MAFMNASSRETKLRVRGFSYDQELIQQGESDKASKITLYNVFEK